MRNYYEKIYRPWETEKFKIILSSSQFIFLMNLMCIHIVCANFFLSNYVSIGEVQPHLTAVEELFVIFDLITENHCALLKKLDNLRAISSSFGLKIYTKWEKSTKSF